MSKIEQLQAEGREELEEEMMLASFGFGEANKQRLQSLQDSLIARAFEAGRKQQREELVERLKTEDTFQIEEGLHYDTTTDITDAPPELFANIRGVREGWEACKKVVIEQLLEQQDDEGQ